MKTKKSIILSAMLTIVMCASLIAGATFALFTTNSKVNIAVTSGKVDVTATVDNFKLYSLENIDATTYEGTEVDRTSAGTFINGGTAKFNGGELTLDRLMGGDKVTFAINVVNNSNVVVKYRALVSVKDYGLYEGLNVTLGDMTGGATSWATLSAAGTAMQLNCTVELPADAPAKYQGKECIIAFMVEAIQANMDENTYNATDVYDEVQLRTLLHNAPTDGTTQLITLRSDIVLEMLYAADNYAHSGLSVADNDVTQNTLNNYKIGVHPLASDPDHWNPLVTNQTPEEKVQMGAFYHTSADDERIARLVVKGGQNVVIDLNGYKLRKASRATHGDWSNVCTDIIANYGTLVLTDSSELPGGIFGQGYNSCNGAVVHNYENATCTIEKIVVDGNAAGFEAHTGQYVVSNEGGTMTIDSAIILDDATSASLLVNNNFVNADTGVTFEGTTTVKGDTYLIHKYTKTVNCKGGTVVLEDGINIASETYAVYVAGGTVEVGDINVTGEFKEAGGTIVFKGTTAHYTLESFNALTEVPSNIETVYVTLNNVSVQDGIVIGNANLSDHYMYSEWNDNTAPAGYTYNTGRTNTRTSDGAVRYLYSTGKRGYNIIVNGSVEGAADTGTILGSQVGAITFKVPDNCTATFEDVTFGEGQYTFWVANESFQSTVVGHTMKAMTFEGCTFNGNWLQNGNIKVETLTIEGSTFNKYDNTISKNNSNPIWVQNIGSCNVVFKNNTVYANRPIKMAEGVAYGEFTFEGNEFHMGNFDDATGSDVYKNVAIMFCQSELGNVLIANNTVNAEATALVAFYDSTSNYPTMKDGATFKMENNNTNGTKLSVLWKTQTSWVPSYVGFEVVDVAEGATAENIADAIKNSSKSEVSLAFGEGTYTLPTITNKTVNITGTKDTVIDMANKATADHGLTLNMDGVTVKFGTNDYCGFQHATKLVYTNCTIYGKQFLYATDVEFINCEFVQENVDYNVWTYGAKNVLFKDCTFNCKGKSVLIYNEGSTTAQTVEFQNCKFNASASVAGKAAIEIDSRFTEYNVIIDQATADNVTGFDLGSKSGSSVWNVKDQAKTTVVTVAGKTVYSK